MRRLLSLPLALLSLVPLVDAQQFQSIRPGTAPVLSGDGLTVAYVDAGGGGARRWRLGVGTTPLSPLVGGTMEEPFGVSDDGTIVVGRRLGPPCEVVWTLDGTGAYQGAWQLSPTGECSPHGGVADDGTFGLSTWSSCGTGCTVLMAARHTLGGSVLPAGDMTVPTLGQEVVTISRDGLAVGGSDEGAGGKRAAIWRQGTTTFPLVTGFDPVGLGTVVALDEAGDRAAIVRGSQALFWDRFGFTQQIFPPPGALRFEPTGMTADGELVVGTVVTASGTEGHVWTKADGLLRPASEYFALRGLGLSAGLAITTLDGISRDGKHVCGTSNQTVFWAELAPWTEYGTFVSATNDLSLTGFGDGSLGGTFQPRTVGTPSTFTATVAAARRTFVPGLGGVLLVDVGVLYPPIDVVVDTSFNSLATFVLPSDPGLAGLRAYFQSARPDATKPAGWALSNGLELLLCE